MQTQTQSPPMTDEKLEFFKLDEIDRRSLFWIMDNAPQSIYSWTEYVANDYRQHKSIQIDPQKLLAEIQAELGEH